MDKETLSSIKEAYQNGKETFFAELDEYFRKNLEKEDVLKSIRNTGEWFFQKSFELDSTHKVKIEWAVEWAEAHSNMTHQGIVPLLILVRDRSRVQVSGSVNMSDGKITINGRPITEDDE